MTVPEQVEDGARAVHGSGAAKGLVRAGVGARGLVWLVVSLLTFLVAAGSNQQADQTGALRSISAQPLGTAALGVVVVCFAGLTLFLLLDAAVGHWRDPDRSERYGHRAKSLAKAVLYGALAVSTARFVLTGRGEDDPSSVTARVLALPAGRWVTGIVGLLVVALGLALAVRALRHKHREKLDLPGVPDRLRRPVVLVGAAGLLGRGLGVALLGALVTRAALTADAEQAKGLDAVAQGVADRPYGQVLLVLAAVGVLAFALWSFAEAAWADLDDGVL